MASSPPEFDHELRRLAERPVEGMHRYMENAGYAETRAAGALNVVLRTLVNLGKSSNQNINQQANKGTCEGKITKRAKNKNKVG